MFTITRNRETLFSDVVLRHHPRFKDKINYWCSQMGKKESIEDTAKVLGRMFDGIKFRGFKQTDAEALAKFSGVPVWNGLIDEFHPTQMLADILTLQEEKGHRNMKGLKFVYFGDSRFNMANSYMVVSAKLGMHFVACAPKDLWPDKELLKKVEDIAKKHGGSITLTEDHKTAAKYADAIALMCEYQWEKTHQYEGKELKI